MINAPRAAGLAEVALKSGCEEWSMLDGGRAPFTLRDRCKVSAANRFEDGLAWSSCFSRRSVKGVIDER